MVSGTALMGISAADYTAAAASEGAPFKIIGVAMQNNPFAIASLSVKSLLIVAVALVLSGSNLVGYMKCSKDAKKQLQGFIISQM